MATTGDPVTTQQREFLEAHGIDPAIVVAHGVQPAGVTVLWDGGSEHPWAEHAEVLAQAGGVAKLRLPYPDEATRAEAIAARNDDFAETVGAKAAAMWDGLIRSDDTPVREGP